MSAFDEETRVRVEAMVRDAREWGEWLRFYGPEHAESARAAFKRHGVCDCKECLEASGHGGDQ